MQGSDLGSGQLYDVFCSYESRKRLWRLRASRHVVGRRVLERGWMIAIAWSAAQRDLIVARKRRLSPYAWPKSVTGRQSLFLSNRVATTLLQSLGFLARLAFVVITRSLGISLLTSVMFRSDPTILSSIAIANLPDHLGSCDLRRFPILSKPHVLRTKKVVPSRHEILVRDTHPTTIQLSILGLKFSSNASQNVQTDQIHIACA